MTPRSNPVRWTSTYLAWEAEQRRRARLRRFLVQAAILGGLLAVVLALASGQVHP